jgi:nucleotide-binding universal stress UspA family protein
MLKSILVGLDGSPFATAATELGIRWAQQFDALLAGLGIIDLPTISGPQAVPLGGMAFKEQRDESLAGEARRKVETALQAFAQRCAEAGVSCASHIATGLPAEQILLEAQRCDLILLGQQTYFQFETQSGPDETLPHVVKHSPRPVVAVPEKSRDGSAVVVAYDGSLQAARTLQTFQGTGLSRSHDVFVVCIHPDPTEAAKCAQRAFEFLRFHDIAAHSRAIGTSDAPAQTILELVESLDAGLLVMGAYGQPTLKEFFFGSVTRTVLEQSPVPVFLYH